MNVTLRGISRALQVTVGLSMVPMVAGAVDTYRLVPPVPDRVVTPNGTAVFAAAAVAAGEVVFRRRSLMDYGTVLKAMNARPLCGRIPNRRA